MKRNSLVLAIGMLAASAGLAEAYCQGFPLMILKEEGAALSGPYTDCNQPVEPGVPFRLHFFLNCEISSDYLSHLEVRYPDWPTAPAADQGRMEFTWLADHASGDLRNGLVLDWDSPLDCELVETVNGNLLSYRLGSVEIEAFSADWLSEPLVVVMVVPLGLTCSAVVTAVKSSVSVPPLAASLMVSVPHALANT